MRAKASGGQLLAFQTPQKWDDPTSANDYHMFADVEVQIIGLSVAFTPQRSFDGSNFVACNAYDKDGNTVTSISADGIYSLPGGAYLKLISGTATAVYVRAGV